MIYYVDDNAKPTGEHEIHTEYCVQAIRDRLHF
jgi:hypothetical protein